MTSGYVRQSAATIVTGNTIQASDFNNEYNQLQSAFDKTTGHDHSGGTGLGQPIPLTTSVSGILPTANGGTGIAYFTAAGPTIARVYTFPDAACSILTTNALITGTQGGTGVNNGSSTITLGGNFTTSGAACTLTLVGSTNVTLPTSGTLCTTLGSSSIVTVGTLATGTWNASVIGPAYGGTGVGNNSTNTITFSGNFGLTLTLTNTTSLTLPTSGTLVSTSVTALSSLATVGTITSGVWTGTTIAIANGGTGATTATNAFNALSPLTTSGDIIYGGVSGAGTRLGANSTATNKYLQSVNSGTPSWAQVAFGDLSGKAATSQGGTNADTSASTGVAQVSSGTWSVSTALANGTTATKQTALDNSTKVATTSYVDSAVAGGSPNVYQATPGNPIGTTSTVGVMCGLAGAITPSGSGTILIIISGDITNISSDGWATQIRYGTSTAPINGAALTGTAVGGKVTNGTHADSAIYGFSVQAIVTGLTPSTAYWIDLAQYNDTGGGTTNIKDISISAYELK